MTDDLAPLHPEGIYRLVSRWEPRHWTVLAAVPNDPATAAEISVRAAALSARRYSTGQVGLLLASLARHGLVSRTHGPATARWSRTARWAAVRDYGLAAGHLR